MNELQKKYNVKFSWLDFNKRALYTSDCLPWKNYIEDINIKIEIDEQKRQAEIIKTIQEKNDFIALIQEHGYTLNQVRRLFTESDCFYTCTIQEYFLSIIDK